MKSEGEVTAHWELVEENTCLSSHSIVLTGLNNNGLIAG